jgi:hypothetical protein
VHGKNTKGVGARTINTFFNGYAKLVIKYLETASWQNFGDCGGMKAVNIITIASLNEYTAIEIYVQLGYCIANFKAFS